MKSVQRILVTGSNGFVGVALVKALLLRGFSVRITGQARTPELEAMGAVWFPMMDLGGGNVDWRDAIQDMDAIVHLAAIAHRVEAVTQGEEEAYDRVNHLATRALATAIAASATCRRFLFISTVRVHGDPRILPVVEGSPFLPNTAYDFSKIKAEEAIREVLGESRVNWTIFRPVLVYGKGNKGNMARLEGLIRSNMPIPVSRTPNMRSFLFLGNLVSGIEAYLTAQDPPSGRAWIISDDQPISTEALVRAMSRAMGIPVRIMHVPGFLLEGAALVGDGLSKLGMKFPWTTEVRKKLLGDNHVDISAIKGELDWAPPYTTEQGIAITYE